ncbi:hypothetical protein G7Y89_g3768 [Cudoniella acicularis]|uniref:Uncharacterized protein n=1 Tax=Cudoniella acicularis TaxID=354080 RepID=A0A8H4RQQ4_9HELO|nr:hypothetical protein G7Y89_g3768 [Cudoniella acicularis]
MPRPNDDRNQWHYLASRATYQVPQNHDPGCRRFATDIIPDIRRRSKPRDGRPLASKRTTSQKQACVPPIALASFEEEASTEGSPILEALCDSARNSRLPGASYATQPEYAFAVWVANPGIYLLKKFNSSA